MISRSFGISFFKKYGFSALFLLIFVVKFSFLKSTESISVLKKRPASAGILFFLSRFLEVQTYNLLYFILIFCIQITCSFQLFFFWFFSLSNIFLGTYFLFWLMVSSVSRSFGIIFLKKYGFLALFLLNFVDNFSFLKSISVLKKCPASAGILFFFSRFLEVQTYNLFYFVLIFCIYITSSFQIFH